MDWINENLGPLVVFILAVACSVFWGVYGMIEDEQESRHPWKKNLGIRKAGIFISEFVGSAAGWFCFAVFLNHLCQGDSLPSGDVWWLVGAFIGISGYSYKIVDSLLSKIRN